MKGRGRKRGKKRGRGERERERKNRDTQREIFLQSFRDYAGEPLRAGRGWG